jgi:Tfp pilus assembly protein PilF
MATPNREAMLQMAIRAAKEDNIDSARMMFEQVLAQDKRNERALIWMAKLAESKSERKEWLQKVLKANPKNEVARAELNRLSYSSSAKQNRILLMFGLVIGILIVLAVVFVAFLVLTSPK